MTTSDRSEVTSEARHLAKAAAAAFGGTGRVHQFHDRDETHSIAILTCSGAPQEGFSTYSTIGLHEVPNMLDDNDVRVELAGVAGAGDAEFPNMLATAAFQVRKEGWLAAPGVVFPAMVGDYGLSETLEHLLWVPPFPWEELGGVVVSSELTVHWLLGIPIAESERRLLVEEGYPALERLFELRDVSYYDLRREPVA